MGARPLVLSPEPRNPRAPQMTARHTGRAALDSETPPSSCGCLKVTRDGAALQQQTRRDRPGTAWQAGEEGGGPERACARAGGTGPGARAAARWARLEQATTGSPHRAEATKA